MTKEEILESIKGLTVLELSDLVKALEEEFGVSAAPVAVAAAPVAAGDDTSAGDGGGEATPAQRCSPHAQPGPLSGV